MGELDVDLEYSITLKDDHISFKAKVTNNSDMQISEFWFPRLGGLTNFNGSKDYKKPYSIAGEYRRNTVPVGSLHSPNALGLHDLIGNIFEWCWDWYDDYPGTLLTNPTGPSSGSYRVGRGGSWSRYPQYVRVAFRNDLAPDSRYSYIGFRLARSVQ